MTTKTIPGLKEAKEAALKVLKHNAHGPYHGLPRTAGWGYPEPYTRDLMIAGLGILVSEDKDLHRVFRRVLETLAEHQSSLGHIPSLVHDPEDRGASDTTPLFLLGLGMYRKASGEWDFLEEAAQKSLVWMRYQSPEDRIMVAQLPTSDWRDEQWTLGFALYVNTVVYGYLRLYGLLEEAEQLYKLMNRFTITADVKHRHVHEGLVVKHKPYYAFWSYKVLNNERFDLLGNSLAVLTGIASPTRAKSLISWIEEERESFKEKGMLAVNLPPNFFPYIRTEDPDWRSRYGKYNRPGEYHNGGVWPFICGFYVSAIVAAGKCKLAEERMVDLIELVRLSREKKVDFGFNEWFKAQDGTPQGQDWQTWSAAMFLYAAKCVETRSTPFFDDIRRKEVECE